MAVNEDARPFVALRKDVEDFKKTFDADIETCVALLDSKITSLICDPDSLGNPFGETKRANAQMEFSRAKFEVFNSTKNFFNEIEEKWIKRISDMKSLFLENVEIFLAGTKLEVKFPSEDMLGGSKKSIRNSRSKKSDLSPATSFYPIISSITRNLSAINVPLLSMGKNDDEENDLDDSSEELNPVTYGRAQTTRQKVKGIEQEFLHSYKTEAIPANETPARGTPRSIAHVPRKIENITKTEKLEGPSFPLTPKKVSFMIDEDSSDLDFSSAKEPYCKPTRRRSGISNLTDKTLEDLDMTDVTPKKNVGRRKTMFSHTEEEDVDLSNLTPRKNSSRRKTVFSSTEQADLTDSSLTFARASRSSSKRKTIASSSDLKSDSSPKRLKVSEKKSGSLVAGREKKVNLSECDDDDNHGGSENYTEWMSLKGLDGKTPTTPGIYELKVWRAKKPAFIGSCDSLRQKLTLHKLGQNSGLKHLDKFLERNLDDVQVRYEVVSSIDDAKVEVKNRINSFVAQFKTTPAYN